MKFSDFEEIIQTEAKAMALAINGGDWQQDYSEAQKVGWCLKVKWAMERYSA